MLNVKQLGKQLVHKSTDGEVLMKRISEVTGILLNHSEFVEREVRRLDPLTAHYRTSRYSSVVSAHGRGQQQPEEEQEEDKAEGDHYDVARMRALSSDIVYVVAAVEAIRERRVGVCANRVEVQRRYAEEWDATKSAMQQRAMQHKQDILTRHQQRHDDLLKEYGEGKPVSLS